ncbi:acyltransferase family protein [Hymenobacter sediminis]|uniref:acyltransferase family protein n=1 Tax=Hymenobacter sediminis TaxID=2218621 RepID=UPI001390274F|nr:acyltransferase [Hymenobacter sediminis]
MKATPTNPETAVSLVPALTGVRAVAALLVFVFHHRRLLPTPSPGFNSVLEAFTAELHIGVSIFFTLSGYLLCRRYFSYRFSAGGLGTFLWRRFARIYPLYFLLCTAVFLRLYFRGGVEPAQWWQQYGLNITLLKGFSERWYLSGIGPAWSLAVEECFYILLPLLLLLARRFSLLSWVGVAGLLLALGLGGSYILQGTGWLESNRFVLQATIFGRSAEFLIGAAFARLPATRYPYATSAGVAGVLATLLLLVGIKIRLAAQVSILTLPGLAVNNWFLPCATGLLLHGLASYPSGLQRVLGSRLLVILGYSSYAFYLIHLGVFADFVVARLHLYLPSSPPFPVLLLLTIGASVGLYLLVEKPLHRWLLQLGSSSRAT